MKMIKNRISFVIILALLSILSFVIAFTNPTAKVNADEPVVAVAVVDADFTMDNGAAVRVNGQTADDNGLRFSAKLSPSDYNGIMLNVKNGVYSDIEFGVFIMPYDYIAKYGDLTEENLFGSQQKEAVYDWATWVNNGWQYNGNKVQIINIYNYKMVERDGDYYIDGSITKLHEENIARDFVSAGYIKYAENGVVKYEMADYVEDNQRNSVRSMAYVAQKAIAYTGEDACDTDQKDWLKENYVAKSVVENTKKDFGYIDKSTTSENYTFNLPENVTALRVTTNDAEYSEVPFTCEDGVISIAKSVVDSGISANVLANGENTIYVHTVDKTNADLPVYKVQEECLVVADIVLSQDDASNLMDIIETNRKKHIVLSEDISGVTVSEKICGRGSSSVSDRYTDYVFYGTLDGRGHSITDVKLADGVFAFLGCVVGTVQNIYVDIDRVSNAKITVASSSYATGLIERLDEHNGFVGNVNNVFVKYKFYTRNDNVWGDKYAGTVVGSLAKGTVKNCISELAYDTSGTVYTCVGAIVGRNASGDSYPVRDCYSVVGKTMRYDVSNAHAGGYTVIQNVTSSGDGSPQNAKDCGIYLTYEELFETGSTAKSKIGGTDYVDKSWSSIVGGKLVLSQAQAIKALPAEKGWSKFWSYEEVDGLVSVKFGDKLLHSYYI